MSGRTFADQRHGEIVPLLRRMWRHPLLVGAAEMLFDAARYTAVMVVLMTLLGQLVKLLGAGT